MIASGGLSIPKIGATSFGYDVARQFGLEHRALPSRAGSADIRPLRPREIRRPRRSVGRSRSHGRRAVLPRETVVHAPRTQRPRNPSGIVLLASGAADCKSTCSLASTSRLCCAAASAPTSGPSPPGFSPRRLADVHAPSKPAAALSDREIDAIAAEFHCWRIEPAGSEGYEKAEVTAGGVDTAELSSKTFESKRAPGLYFIGEVVDVTGHLGGFNFQWAWASGYSAGQFV